MPTLAGKTIGFLGYGHIAQVGWAGLGCGGGRTVCWAVPS
jgi:hypothetical protein